MKFHSEEWRAAPGFDCYEVSNLGRVRRSKPGGNNFCKVGRILRLAVEKNGYVRIGLHGSGGVKRMSVHRLVAEAFIGSAPSPFHEVAHIDGNRHFNAASNLRWATRKENHADKLKHGTAQRGGRNPNSKLTRSKAIAIKRSGKKLADIASEYGLSVGTVVNIRKGHTWSHLP